MDWAQCCKKRLVDLTTENGILRVCQPCEFPALFARVNWKRQPPHPWDTSHCGLQWKLCSYEATRHLQLVRNIWLSCRVQKRFDSNSFDWKEIHLREPPPPFFSSRRSKAVALFLYPCEAFFSFRVFFWIVSRNFDKQFQVSKMWRNSVLNMETQESIQLILWMTRTCNVTVTHETWKWP